MLRLLIPFALFAALLISTELAVIESAALVLGLFGLITGEWVQRQ